MYEPNPLYYAGLELLCMKLINQVQNKRKHTRQIKNIAIQAIAQQTSKNQDRVNMSRGKVAKNERKRLAARAMSETRRVELKTRKEPRLRAEPRRPAQIPRRSRTDAAQSRAEPRRLRAEWHAGMSRKTVNYTEKAWKQIET
jgi:hypothetical protein